MKWENYHLGDAVSKTTEKTVLWKAERGLVEISGDSLAVAIKLGEEDRGYVFHAHGKLLLDTIVETREGAVGKPVEKEITQPFLMLGNAEEHLSAACKEDFEKMGYADEHEFLAKAKELFDELLGRKAYSHHCLDVNQGVIFAFPNKHGKFDLLVARESSMVYKSEGLVFVSNGDKTVLKSAKEAVCVTSGKSVVLKACCVPSLSSCRKECP